MKKIVLLGILVTVVLSQGLSKIQNHQVKNMTGKAVQPNAKVVLKKEIPAKPKSYPRGNIATH